MKLHPTQFGVRESTASTRQHAPRLVVSNSQSQSNGERTENARLLSVHDVADLLQVPASWVYGHTRDRCPDRIPGFRLGKYWRFDEADVLAWIQRRRLEMRRNSFISEYNGTR